ncbi:MAG: DUF4124 domain-containing protein [Chromatiaceae bacterium]|nr:DUF4124 domain-containing protein [Chromatiaceae bacterium]
MYRSIALLIALLLLSVLASSSDAGLYRWVDEEGEVHYSDSVPPERVKSEHTELNKAGVRVKIVPHAKTPEEAQKELELQRMRAQQRQLLEEQHTADRVLLKTFRTEDDLTMARDGKIAAVDVMIEVARGNISRQQTRHAELLAKAANLERAGNPVPPHLSDAIAKAERAIRDTYAGIVDREEQKRDIRARSDRDLKRFRELRNLPASNAPVPKRETRPILHNIVTCPNPEECDRLWKKATDFVRQHSTTSVQASSSVIFITAPPMKEQDISLILSRISHNDGQSASLFLDLQCKRSVRGKEFCRGPKTQGIIKEFRPALTGEDNPRP